MGEEEEEREIFFLIFLIEGEIVICPPSLCANLLPEKLCELHGE